MVMTFDVEFDETHRVCIWLMDAFKDSREKLGYWLQWTEHLPNQDSERIEPSLEPRMIATVHPKRKNQVAFCLHLSGNLWFSSPIARSSFGRLSCYDISSSGFVTVSGAGVRTESIVEAIQVYIKKQASPANMLSCIVNGIPGDVMKTVWWAMIGETKGFMIYLMYGIIPGHTVRETSCDFDWDQLPSD